MNKKRRRAAGAAGRPDGSAVFRLRWCAALTATLLVVSCASPARPRLDPGAQVVWIRATPELDSALRDLGLLAQRAAWLAELRDATARHFSGLGIELRLDQPARGVYMTVELGGADPNGQGLLGLDNSTGKDVGNRERGEYLGGYDPLAAALGQPAWGGVFVGSLLSFSTRLPQRDPALADPRFDTTMACVLPALGGHPAEGEPAGDPARAACVRGALEMSAHLVANTLAHEIGHALGLPAAQGRVHNLGDNPGWIMDAGAHRGFAERAELPGAPKSMFSPGNLRYLRLILPEHEP